MTNEEFIAAELADRPAGQPQLLPLLHALQHGYGRLTADMIPAIAQALNISTAEVYGVITFYDDFHLDRSPPAIKICAAEGCQASGARDLLERARGQFEDAVEEVFCLGNCALGPCAMVGETVGAQADTTRLADLLEKQTDS